MKYWRQDFTEASKRSPDRLRIAYDETIKDDTQGSKVWVSLVFFYGQKNDKAVTDF